MEGKETEHPMYKKISEDNQSRIYQDIEFPLHFMYEVSQESRLGKLGLESFIDKGIHGPNYDLSDLPVVFHYNPKFDVINVSLHDMDIDLEKKDKNYKDIKSYLEKIRNI